MNKTEFRERIKALGFNYGDFCKFIGKDRTTISRWQEVPLYAVRIIELLEKVKGGKGARKS